MPFDDTQKAHAPRWRKLQPDLDQISAEKAIVLALHHLELARAFFDCVELERDPNDPRSGYDDPDRDEADNQVRLNYALAALEKRYPEKIGNGDLREGAKAFLRAVIATQDRENREWHEGPIEGDASGAGGR